METDFVTFTAKAFDFLAPNPNQICITDIARSLSNICRFNGFTRKFYSVAEHSVRLAESKEVTGDKLKLLMHDSAEAYLGDVVSPRKSPSFFLIKQDSEFVFEKFRTREKEILKIIGIALEIDLSEDQDIKQADYRILLSEIRDLMPKSPLWDRPYYHQDEPLKEKIEPWTPDEAYLRFLRTYFELKGI